MDKEKFFHINEYVNNFERKKDIQSMLIIESTIVKPIISFVIPTFNRPDTLTEAIESVLKQNSSVLEYELIILDNSGNHSSDNPTLNVVKQYKEPHLSYYQNSENLGFEGNFNRGIELARGEWIAFLHDDDLVTDDYLEKIKNLLDKYDKSKDIGYIKTETIVFSDQIDLENKKKDLLNISGMSRILWGKLKRIRKIDSLILGYLPTCIPSCGTLMRKVAMIDIGGFNPDYYPSFDAYPGYQMIGKYKVYQTYEPLGYYRWSVNISLKKNTILGFLEANYYFRQFLYKENLLFRFYGKIFGEAYYSKNVDDWKQKASQQGVDISDGDIARIHSYKKCSFRKKIVTKIQIIFNKVNKLVSVVCQ